MCRPDCPLHGWARSARVFRRRMRELADEAHIRWASGLNQRSAPLSHWFDWAILDEPYSDDYRMSEYQRLWLGKWADSGGGVVPDMRKARRYL